MYYTLIKNQYQVKRNNDISQESRKFDSITENFTYSSYEKIHLTFSTRRFDKSFITALELEDIVNFSFFRLENRIFRGFLKENFPNLRKKIALRFPKFSFSHTEKEFDKNEHIHVLILMPPSLLPLLENSYEMELEKYNRKTNSKIKSVFLYQHYSGSSLNFFHYVMRKVNSGINESQYYG